LRRYHDFNVYTSAKVRQKLHYIHANPVEAKLVKHPGDWPWSSWCFYYRGGDIEDRSVDLNGEGWTNEKRARELGYAS